MTDQPPTPVDYATSAVTELRAAVEQLAGCLQQGVVRPWRPPALTAERRNDIDREARAEYLERDGLAPGEHPAPLDLDVMDELVEILSAVEVMVTRVAVAAWCPRPAPATSAFADPRPHLRLITALLPAAQGSVDDATVVRWVEVSALKLVERAQQTLGLATDGQVLQALCPWCSGRTDLMPVGGEYTLRIRSVKGLAEPLVICEGGHCEPPPADCGTWVRGRPAWRPGEWDWLAMRLDHAAGQTA